LSFFRVAKRVFDFAVSLAALVCLSPVFAVVTLIIARDDGLPVFFRQERVGKGAVNFKIWKFRTMKKSAPRSVPTGELENAEACITKSGAFLRKTSLDELPQLINVLFGSMSLVGPRPLIPEEVAVHHLRSELLVYRMTPGLTGWAQVNGRDRVTIEEKIMLDREYYKKSSVMFDLKILLKTVFVVLKKDGYAEGRQKVYEGSDEDDV